MKIFFLALLCVFTPSIIHAQAPSTTHQIPPNLQEEHVAGITRIVRHVARGIIAPNQETLTPQQETLIAQISQQLIQEAEIYQAEQTQTETKRKERRERITTIIVTIAKGIAIIIALLILRVIIKAVGRSTATESTDTPIGIIITTRTPDEALALGKQMIDQKLATGGTITPTIQSLYRKDDKAYVAPEAMLMLKTTNKHIKDIMTHTTSSNTSAPEIIALSRAIIPV